MSPLADNRGQRNVKPLHLSRLNEDQTKNSRAAYSTTVAKALSITEILASSSEAGISLIELSVLLDMPKSTIYRYLATLLELRLAERCGIDRYRLGTKVIELAGSFLAGSDLRKESESILDEIAEKTGETVHLAVPSGSEVVYIAKVESKHTLRMYSHIGARLPIHCTALGKSILAFSGIERIQEVLPELSKPRTANTITSEQALLEELDLIRLRGFAIDDEENEFRYPLCRCSDHRLYGKGNRSHEHLWSPRSHGLGTMHSIRAHSPRGCFEDLKEEGLY